MSTFKGWVPYVLLALFLVASRIIEPLKAALTSINLSWNNILGEAGVSGGVQPLYLPGGIIIAVVIVTYFLHRMNPQKSAPRCLNRPKRFLVLASC
ncbi:hypothetical protein HORIV_54100 [Vreelandella olivaria]|uniref:Uncharacterized protein n=1 Tax=Vreelandella olivaria TaxID=390919 RepID=A0ABN5X163_9GAMM|nr:hypothetical protein HORIV_54100 [Halomonas olivaria]